MIIKKIYSTIMVILYCLFINHLYRINDLSVLYKGVNTENNIMLLMAHFFDFIIIAFYFFGETEKYTNGYGKYILIRTKSRTNILNSIYVRNFFSLLYFEVIKIAFFITILGIYKTTLKTFLIMVILSVLINYLLISFQLFIELLFGSKIALLVIMIYFMISCTTGGIFISEKFYILLLFLIPNYSMGYRIEYFTDKLNMSFESIIFILIALIVGSILAQKKFLKTMDIF